MITIQVFHAAFEETPRHVANLTSHAAVEFALEEAFTATQNVESSWVTSRGQMGVSAEPTAEVLKQGGCRSTSVGDYARVVDETGAESFYRCQGRGWKPITDRAELSKAGTQVMMAAYGFRIL
jgi:hypothetical protein